MAENLQEPQSLLREWLNNATDSGGTSAIEPKIKDIDTLVTATALSVVELQTINSLVPSGYDYIALTYDGSDNLTGVVFKDGGAGGTTVSTLVLSYTGSRLDSVTQS